MASRSEQILIYLRTFGAAKSRRDIKSVADEMTKLNDQLSKNTRVTNQNNKAQDTQAGHRANEVKQIREVRKETEKNLRAQRGYASTMERQIKAGNVLPAQTYKQLNAMKKLDAQKQKSVDGFERQWRSEMNNIDRQIRKHRNYTDNVAKGWKSVTRVLREAQDIEYKVNRNRQTYTRARVNALGRERIALEKVLKVERKRLLSPVKNVQLPEARHIGRFLKYFTIIGSVLDLIPFIGTGLNSIAAAALAATNGLGPLVGMLVALPAGLLTLLQFVGTGALIFHGMGDAFSADEKKSSEALAKLGNNARDFVNQLKPLKDDLAGLQNTVQEVFFKGLGDQVNTVVTKLLPILNSQLFETANGLNIAAFNMTGWMQSSEGLSTINAVMGDAAYEIGQGADAAQRFGQVWLIITKTAGPMMRELAGDINNLSDRLYNYVSNNQDKLTNFFSGSYDLLKKTLKVIGNFGMGLFNIIKLADPLTNDLGKGITEASQGFRDWTESADGIRDIKQYFEDMREPFKAVMHFAGQFAQAIFDISRQKNFSQLMNSITNDLLPKLVEIFNRSSGKFIPLIISMIENFETLANAGTLDVIADISRKLVDIISWLTKVFAGSPPWVRSALIWGAALTFLFGGWFNSIKGMAMFLGQAVGSIRKISGAKAGLANLGATSGAAGSLVTGGAAPRRSSGVVAGKGGKARRAAGRVGGKLSGVSGGAVLGGAGIAATLGGMFLSDHVNPFDNRQILASVVNNPNASDLFGNSGINNHGFGFSALSTRNVTDVSSATGRLFNKSKYEKFTDAFDPLTSLFGTTDSDNIKEVFGSLDTGLTMLDDKTAADRFKKYAAQMKQNGASTQQIIDLFPQYRSKIESTIDPLQLAGMNAENLAAKMGIFVQAMTDAQKKLVYNPSSTYFAAGSGTKKPKKSNGASTAGTGAGNIIGPGSTIGGNNFAGGMIPAGATHMVGELGAEFALTRSGKMSLVGQSGAQLFSPSSNTAIIPASATSDPANGNYGLAPDWAKNALQNAAGITSTPAKAGIPQNRERASEGGTHYHLDVRVGGDARSANMSLEIRRAIAQIERERRERK